MDLTQQQADVLASLESGMSVRDIGEKLGITRNAVYLEIQALKEKGELPPQYTQSAEIRAQPPGQLGAPDILERLEQANAQLVSTNAQIAGVIDKLTGHPPKKR